MRNRVVVVTGGSTGIGRATVELLAQQGATVIAFARSSPQMRELSENLPQVTTVEGDVSQSADVSRLFALVSERFGRVDGLFVNAGIAEFVPLDETDEAHFDRVFAVNVRGAFLTARAANPLLREGSSVVFNTSVSALVGCPAGSVYGASKGAVAALATNLGAEWIGRGIRVNAVAPGPTETPILAKSAVSEPQMAQMAPFVMQRMRSGRLAQASEVASAVAYLLSPQASFITGQHLAIDGGMTGL